ncbi:MAG: hypothetical protein KF757_07630 [Phycisphaeraceae bacterium]|nr:hypothetical protein [Phycisphaeraceae bacterium]MCW5762627.1 hypothetical protein [Phycisphaeraceae bacterium]
MSVASCLVRLCLGVMLLGTSGCASPKKNGDSRPDISRDDLVARHNERVASLDRVWARTSVQVTARNERGGRLREQVEGHLQIEQPDRVAMSLGKLGKVQLYLGSNEQGYWWMDMVENSAKVALFGRHAFADEDKAASLGVPVYPRDLVHLLGITPLDVMMLESDVRWDKGLAGVVAPMSRGSRVVWFDPRSAEPQRVELRNAAGLVVLVAELSRYDFVNVVGDATRKPRIANSARITLVDQQTRVDVSLYGVENRPIRASAFDFEGLARGYRIDEIYDLDAQTPAQAMEP